MNRIDSVAGSYLPKASSKEPMPNNTTTRHRKPHRNTGELITSIQPAKMEPRRPVSEQRSRPLRQQSTTSSSENSNGRSRSRGHGSKPSSRRTSCTIVDPSRPARHYRMKSFQTPATTTGQDVDDVLALHFRSCSIFTNPSYHSNPGLPSPTLSQGDAFGFPSAATRFSSDSLRVVEEASMHRQSEDTIDAERPTQPCTGHHHVRENASTKESTRQTAVCAVSSAKSHRDVCPARKRSSTRKTNPTQDLCDVIAWTIWMTRI
jgi:hypothetical protein